MSLVLKMEEAIKEINSRIKAVKSDSYIVGVAGGSCSGKSYLVEHLEGRHLSMDDYYKGKSRIRGHNFDRPKALDLDLLVEHLKLAKLAPDHGTYNKPVYSFETGERKGYEYFKFGKIIIVEGLFALHKKLRNLLDLKIYVECDEDKRLKRRLKRDEEIRKVSGNILRRWNKYVLPMHKKYVEPTKIYADILVIN